MADFFEEPKEVSEAKIRIVSKYYSMWSKIMKKESNNSQNKFAYIDLFSGPGFYKDGTKSIPINILENTLEDEEKRKKLVAVFNDSDPETSQILERNIENIGAFKSLSFKPQVGNAEVDHETVESFRSINFAPTLLFIDPWGYKGLSIDLVGSILKDWGCDCIFFFNYNRINAALNNPAFESGSINYVFGAENTRVLQNKIENKPPAERESIILEFLKSNLKTQNAQYTFVLRFKQFKTDKTSHFLILVSKSPLAHSLIKGVVYDEATNYSPEIDAFEYDPKISKQLQLFEIGDIEYLKSELTRKYSGESMKMKDVYESHHIGTPYLKKHYKRALLELEEQGKIHVPPDGRTRKKNTLADYKIVQFKS
jgi:three-Cys-motif partner protein